MVVVRDWADLYLDLLAIITKKLDDISNLIRFRAVCKKWRSVAVPSNPSPQLPWLISSTMHNERPHSFYSLYSNKIHNISILEAHQKFIKGPSKHYLLVADFHPDNIVSSSLFLLNPLTKTQIPLLLNDVIYYVPVYIGPPSSPTSNGVVNDAVVILLLCPKDSTLAFFVRQSNTGIWTRIEVPMGVDAMAYYEGRLFVSCDSEETFVIDACTGGVLEKIPNPKQNMCFDYPYGVNYLVEAVDDFLRVVGYFDPLERHLVGFEVYRLGRNGNSSRWNKVSGIGDLMIFLDDDRNGSFCVSASDFDGFKGNCIYFVQSHLRDDHEICRYDMEEGREEVIVSLPNYFKGTWFLPSLF